MRRKKRERRERERERRREREKAEKVGRVGCGREKKESFVSNFMHPWPITFYNDHIIIMLMHNHYVRAHMCILP